MATRSTSLFGRGTHRSRAQGRKRYVGEYLVFFQIKEARSANVKTPAKKRWRQGGPININFCVEGTQQDDEVTTMTNWTTRTNIQEVERGNTDWKRILG